MVGSRVCEREREGEGEGGGAVHLVTHYAAPGEITASSAAAADAASAAAAAHAAAGWRSRPFL